LSEAPLFEKATPEVAFCFLVNRLLAAEPWARLRLVPYVGEVVELRAPPFPALRLRILEGGTVEAGSAKPSLTMTLKPELLPALTRGDEHVVRAVDIRGNDRLAAELLVLAQHLRWDAEEALSRLVGDVAAHRLAGAGRALAGWHMDAARRLLGALGDYLTDEKQLLARRAELDALGESVAHLRDGIARLDKRIGRLD
jgi:ubiquinone biosynthesis protein UbiJ